MQRPPHLQPGPALLSPLPPRSREGGTHSGCRLGWDSTDGPTGCLLVSPPRLQDHHCAEVHAGRRVVGRLSPSGHPCFVPGAPDLEGDRCGTVAGGHCGSGLGTGLADLRHFPESWCPFGGLGRLTSNGLRPAGPDHSCSLVPVASRRAPAREGCPPTLVQCGPGSPGRGETPTPSPLVSPAGDGPRPVQRFCPVFGPHLELL